MITSRVRRRLGSLTWFALCVFLGGAALPIFETHELADSDEAAYHWEGGGHFSLGREAAVSVRPQAPDSSRDAPAHCVLCHWQRAVSGAMASDVAAVASPSAAHSRDRFVVPRPTASAFASHASRAPPIPSSI